MIHIPDAKLRSARRCLWLLLLLALLAPGAHAEAHAVPVAAVSGESGGTAVECDLLETALVASVRGDRRPAVPPRPAPLADPGPRPVAEGRPAPASPCTLRIVRSEVLRC